MPSSRDKRRQQQRDRRARQQAAAVHAADEAQRIEAAALGGRRQAGGWKSPTTPGMVATHSQAGRRRAQIPRSARPAHSPSAWGRDQGGRGVFQTAGCKWDPCAQISAIFFENSLVPAREGTCADPRAPYATPYPLPSGLSLDSVSSCLRTQNRTGNALRQQFIAIPQGHVTDACGTSARWLKTGALHTFRNLNPHGQGPEPAPDLPQPARGRCQQPSPSFSTLSSVAIVRLQSDPD